MEYLMAWVVVHLGAVWPWLLFLGGVGVAAVSLFLAIEKDHRDAERWQAELDEELARIVAVPEPPPLPESWGPASS